MRDGSLSRIEVHRSLSPEAAHSAEARAHRDAAERPVNHRWLQNKISEMSARNIGTMPQPIAQAAGDLPDASLIISVETVVSDVASLVNS